MPEPEETEYGMVMPLVSVASKGGPYDDQAYAAGWEMGQLDTELKADYGRYETTIRTANAGQVDLIAMHRGYLCQTAPTQFEEWTYAVFTKIEVSADD